MYASLLLRLLLILLIAQLLLLLPTDAVKVNSLAFTVKCFAMTMLIFFKFDHDIRCMKMFYHNYWSNSYPFQCVN